MKSTVSEDLAALFLPASRQISWVVGIESHCGSVVREFCWIGSFFLKGQYHEIFDLCSLYSVWYRYIDFVCKFRAVFKVENLKNIFCVLAYYQE